MGTRNYVTSRFGNSMSKNTYISIFHQKPEARVLKTELAVTITLSTHVLLTTEVS